MSAFGYRYLYDSVKEKLKRITTKKDTDVIGQIWDGSVNEKSDFELIKRYYDIQQKNGCAQNFVDETCWSDLDMDEVFHRMDRNITPPGRQFLYHLLRTASMHGNEDAYKNYEFFKDHPEVRTKIQRILLKLRTPSAYFLADLVFSELPDKPRWFFLFPLSAIAMLALVLLTSFKPVFVLAVLLLGLINLLVHRHYTYKIIGFMPNIHDLIGLLNAAIQLSGIRSGNNVPNIDALRKHEATARFVKKKIGLLNIDSKTLVEPLASGFEYLNVFCLMNLITFFRSITVIRQHKAELQELFNAVASLDATISVASYMSSLPFYCKPDFNDDNVIDTACLYHPLLANPVGNSFELANKSCLITGSNMAGKTTFMKTVGLNIIVGKALGICLAKQANLPDVTVRTSIKRMDSINDDKSYYFKEIEAILTFLQLSPEPSRYLFLIDEIFRGTNTIERLSASTAVLDYLSSDNMVFVTTHDIELQSMLGKNFEMFHFSEMIKNNEHYFDYKIKSGPCTTRNAIRLLALKGYPESITNHAIDISRTLSDN